jgi:hypothetical protein
VLEEQLGVTVVEREEAKLVEYEDPDLRVVTKPTLQSCGNHAIHS